MRCIYNKLGGLFDFNFHTTTTSFYCYVTFANSPFYLTIFVPVVAHYGLSMASLNQMGY